MKRGKKIDGTERLSKEHLEERDKAYDRCFYSGMTSLDAFMMGYSCGVEKERALNQEENP